MDLRSDFQFLHILSPFWNLFWHLSIDQITYIVFIRIVLYTKNMGSTYAIHLKISKVENGQFLAESNDIPGLVAQGRTISETVEIAQDVARKLIESFIEHGDTLPSSLKPLSEQAEIDITIGA